MKKTILFFTLAIYCIYLSCNNNIRYTVQDSIRITNILSDLSQKDITNPSQILLETAKIFINTPYAGNTLDKEKTECLTVNINEVDCMTLVEQSLAITLTIKEKQKDFATFCNNLRLIRYRNGKCNGYESRLHYFSQWVKDGEKKGIIHEKTGKVFSEFQKLHLNFMSSNSGKYNQLKNDSTLIYAISEYEKPFRNIKIPYLPKRKLKESPRHIPVNDGDIIALVTNIKGLDVTHTGIAIWISGKLHLLHASYKEKKVIIDKIPLYDYSAKRKSQPGIRVIQVL